MIVKPDYEFEDVYKIDFEQLKQDGVRALLFDLDSTVMPSKSGVFPQEVLELFEKLKNGFLEKYPKEFEPEVLVYKEKKQEPITPKQVRFLKAIIEYHHLELAPNYESMTKSEASRLVDTLLAKHGRIPYVR